MSRRSEFTVEQRREAVLALLRREEPVAQLARLYGISEQTLHRRRDEFIAGGEAALAEGKDGSDARDQEIRALKAELEERTLTIGELAAANRILKKTFGPVELTTELRQRVSEELVGDAELRRTRLLQALAIATRSWYRQPVPIESQKRGGPAPRPIAQEIRQAVIEMALANPWYGYKRIAVMCRRAGQAVKDRHAYAVMRAELLQQARPREPELYQAARLFELLPQKPNDLWQMDVTYIHIPGHGWWYAVTVIDYYSRYLLACRLTNSYSAIEVSHALAEARLGCNLDYDKLQDLAENHRSLRRIMGIGDWQDDEVDFDWRRIEDNLNKLRPATLQKINALVVKAGHVLEPEAIESVRGDTFVVETNIHYPTESSVIGDGLRKIVNLAAELAKEHEVGGSRQAKHLV